MSLILGMCNMQTHQALYIHGLPCKYVENVTNNKAIVKLKELIFQ